MQLYSVPCPSCWLVFDLLHVFLLLKLDFIESTNNICLIISAIYTLILGSRCVNWGRPVGAPVHYAAQGPMMILRRLCYDELPCWLVGMCVGDEQALGLPESAGALSVLNCLAFDHNRREWELLQVFAGILGAPFYTCWQFYLYKSHRDK